MVADFKASCWAHFATGRLSAVVDSIFDWEEVASAHAYMASNRSAGKIVLTVA
ncbi:MAG: zinc-binding dehydrogenase [Saprospiraceae bacterium]